MKTQKKNTSNGDLDRAKPLTQDFELAKGMVIKIMGINLKIERNHFKQYLKQIRKKILGGSFEDIQNILSNQDEKINNSTKFLKKLSRELQGYSNHDTNYERALMQSIEGKSDYLREVYLEYPVKAVPRYGYGKPPHQIIYQIINQHREKYEYYLNKFVDLVDYFLEIPVNESNPEEPNWINGWMPGLDTIALYGFICMHKPKKYYEVGSGNSTKFACKAIKDHKLSTKVISIDPQPRAEIDVICDHIVRKPLEEVDVSFFKDLDKGDILFVDSSHRVFMNSDVTTVFLDILPILKPGVIVHFHDILLPYDYPYDWSERFYSEQYMLAVYLLVKGQSSKILFPSAFISYENDLINILSPIFKNSKLSVIESHGGSFWLEV